MKDAAQRRKTLPRDEIHPAKEAANPAQLGLVAIHAGEFADSSTTALRDHIFLQPVKAKRNAKSNFADWLRSASGQTVDPDTIFNCQIKRIHEYNRQLLNALRIIVLYNRLRENPDLNAPPRTFLFAGRAAPAYHLAKLIIKFINHLAGTVDGDPVTRGRLKVVFLPDCNVSLAELLILAADVCNQIMSPGFSRPSTTQ
jgi:starch phosphorylase